MYNEKLCGKKVEMYWIRWFVVFGCFPLFSVKNTAYETKHGWKKETTKGLDGGPKGQVNSADPGDFTDTAEVQKIHQIQIRGIHLDIR